MTNFTNWICKCIHLSFVIFKIHAFEAVQGETLEMKRRSIVECVCVCVQVGCLEEAAWEME